MFRFLFTYLIILLALCALPYAAQADGDPTTDNVPRILPYQGILELDGQPVNATGDNALHLGFQIFDGPDAELPVYRQDLRVEVYAGRFIATIGPVGVDGAGAEVPISQVVANADDLYLGMILLGDPADPADDIALSNRQRIHATPYAMWASSATNLSVAQDLRVGRNVTVAGDMTVQGALNLPAGAIETDALADAAVRPAKLALGDGLSARGGDTVGVDDAYLDARIRGWVRDHCRLTFGWRDGCNGCGSPAKEITVQANGLCVGGRAASCRSNNTWGGLNFDGTVDENDDVFFRLECD